MNRWRVWDLLGDSRTPTPCPDGVKAGTYGRHREGAGVQDLANELREILVPVVTDAVFRRRLRGELQLEAQRRQLGPEPTLFQQHRTGILVGAAAIGSIASVAGVIVAVVLRNRNGRATNVAAG